MRIGMELKWTTCRHVPFTTLVGHIAWFSSADTAVSLQAWLQLCRQHMQTLRRSLACLLCWSLEGACPWRMRELRKRLLLGEFVCRCFSMVTEEQL